MPAHLKQFAPATAEVVELFECELTKIRPQVFRVAMSRLRNADAAEEVTQNTLLQCWRKLSTWRRQSNIRTWAVAVCRNEAGMYYRKETHATMQQPPHFVYTDHLEPQEWAAIEREISL